MKKDLLTKTQTLLILSFIIIINSIYGSNLSSSMRKIISFNKNIIQAQQDLVFISDYSVINREFEFNIYQNNSCYVEVTDKVKYDKEAYITFVEHVLVKQNVTHIIPIEVYTEIENTGLESFGFSEEMMVFNLNFNNKTTNVKEFDVYYKYYIYGLFQVDIDKKNSTVNYFEYKFLNENSNDVNHKTKIDINWLYSSKEKNKLEFIKDTLVIESLKLNKDYELSVRDFNSTFSVLNFKYELNQVPQQLLFLNATFSKQFEYCGYTIIELIEMNIWVLFILALIIFCCLSNQLNKQPETVRFKDM